MDIDTEEIFTEIQKKMEREAAWTEEEYFDLIDETLEEKRDWGELPDSDDFEALRASLRAKWEDVRRG